HLRPAGGQPQGDGLADPPRGPRHQGHLAVQIHRATRFRRTCSLSHASASLAIGAILWIDLTLAGAGIIIPPRAGSKPKTPPRAAFGSDHEGAFGDVPRPDPPVAGGPRTDDHEWNEGIGRTGAAASRRTSRPPRPWRTS